jgi:hypothetical protein
MPFSRKDVDALLVASHRRCCTCRRFCGVKIDMHHIVPRNSEGVKKSEFEKNKTAPKGRGRLEKL